MSTATYVNNKNWDGNKSKMVKELLLWCGLCSCLKFSTCHSFSFSCSFFLLLTSFSLISFFFWDNSKQTKCLLKKLQTCIARCSPSLQNVEMRICCWGGRGRSARSLGVLLAGIYCSHDCVSTQIHLKMCQHVLSGRWRAWQGLSTYISLG